MAAPADRDRADRLITAVEEALAAPTAYRDGTPLPQYGTTPPVTQPGRPPMSQKATDASALMLTGSVLTLATGGAASAILWASGQADPTVIGLIAAAPIAVAAPIWALSRLVQSASKTETHHHYTGPVHHHTVNSHSRWLGKTTNNL
ncbi:hypothetical protein [Streptomyces sp. NPDC059165]|uniref:hypothetical protein n=1 Tax=Streptomyces sp. NPDC059165 TaxID=3346751 RepID=UPI0036D1D070